MKHLRPRPSSGRGRDCAWFPAVDWEALLARPLEDVRAQLRVGAPPVYREFRSAAGEAALANPAS